jgi:predicted aspartyl protease
MGLHHSGMRSHQLAALAFAALLCACAAPSPAPDSAEACRFDQRGAFPLAFAGSVPVVSVVLNGQPAKLALDTGSPGTIIGTSAAERLKLIVVSGKQAGLDGLQVSGLGGRSDAGLSVARRIDLGGAVLENRLLVVLPFDLRGPSSGEVDGLLGMDVLSTFDVELDLKARKGALYAPRNCPSGPPDWGVKVNTVTLLPDGEGHKLRVHATLDGRTTEAIIDTGSTVTYVSTGTAHAVGVTDEALAADRMVSVSGVAARDSPFRVHKFRRLRIGKEAFADPEIPVGALPLPSVNMMIGMSYLQNRKLWISSASKRVYIGPPLQDPLPARAAQRGSGAPSQQQEAESTQPPL